jgi:hypothetical protein
MGVEKAVLGDRMAFAWHFFAVKSLVERLTFFLYSL